MKIPLDAEFNEVPTLRFVFDGIKHNPRIAILVAAMFKSPYAIPDIESWHSETTGDICKP